MTSRPWVLAPWLLALPVAAAHFWLASMWPADRLGWGAESSTRPVRIEVAFVRELQPAPPPAAAAPAEPRTRVLRAPQPVAVASAAASALTLDLPPLPEPARPPQAEPSQGPAAAGPPELPALPSLDSLPPLASLTPAMPPGPAATAATAQASAGAFEWPPSTRLSYVLSGNYQGPVEGQAQVEWRLAGQRYQVALELGIGPPMAPLVTRQLLSDGWVTAAGLEPRRYDEETRIVLRSPRRLTISLEPDRVVLPSGRQVPRPAGLQDSASQFVQMTWMFTMQPALLAAGQRLQLPLALPRQVETWTYEVVGPELLHTPLGELDTVHVRPLQPPRSAGSAGPAGRAGDLTAEFWVAPSLQNLPVRIFIRQDEETYVDLRLRRLPQQAASAPGSFTTR